MKNSISHDDALRSLFAEQPDFAMAYVKELRNQMYGYEEKAEKLRCVIADLQDQAAQLETENTRLKRQMEFLVTDLIDVASDYSAPMDDCRSCDYSHFCQRKPDQCEPVREMCEAAVLKSCEPRENGE